MTYLIIDTNVPLKAANLQPEDDIDRACSLSCFRFIKAIMNSDDVVVLDDNQEILREYRNKINIDLQDNVATEFLMWLYHKIRDNTVEMHRITKTDNNTYVEFPDSPDLTGFDQSDRKFVALSKAHPAHPNIYNGSDTDWWAYKDALEAQGVHVVFLCEEYMRAKYKGS